MNKNLHSSDIKSEEQSNIRFLAPEPKAHKVSQWSVVRPSSPLSTLSNLNISEASGPILVEFYV